MKWLGDWKFLVIRDSVNNGILRECSCLGREGEVNCFLELLMIGFVDNY